MKPDLEAIRARDELSHCNDVRGEFDAVYNAARRDRRDLLAYVDALREAAAEGLRLLEYADTSDAHKYGTLDTGLVRMLLDRLRRLLGEKP